MVMSKITKAVAKKITSSLDNMEVAMFGGELSKAEFHVYKDVDISKIDESVANINAGGKGNPHGVIRFFLNPHTIQVTKEAQLKDHEVSGGTTEKKYAKTFPVCLKLGEIWFDTYDTRESVRTKYINDIEALLDYIKDTHYTPIVVFNWGQFSSTARIPSSYKFLVTKVTVDYTLFLPDGTPVRAKVDMSLEQLKTQRQEAKEAPKASPDHAKLYTVKRGDTLQGIAMAEYDDPREWRRIAKTNNLNDPMMLRPGMKLLVPPILK